MLSNQSSHLMLDVRVFDEMNLNLAQLKALATISSAINPENFHISTLQDFNSIMLDLLFQAEQLMLKFVLK